MPPGYTPHCMDLTNSVSDSDSPEPGTAPIASNMYHNSTQESSECYGSRERQFGRERSNERGYYPSDTSSYTSSRASSSRSRIPPPSSSQSHMNGVFFEDAYRHPRGQSFDKDLQSDRDSTVITLRREKNHLEHKVSKLEAKVISLEGELSSSHKLYAQLLARLGSLQIAPGDSSLCPTTAMDPFMALLKDVCEKDNAPYETWDHFPSIVYWYWTKADYLKDYQIGREYLKAKRDDNSGSISFMEDENGVVISKEDQQRTRDHQRALCYTLLKFGLAPITWSQITEPAREFFVRSMRTKFAILRYCEDDWNAGSGSLVKQEEVASTELAGKRRPSTTTALSRKRTKVEPTPINEPPNVSHSTTSQSSGLPYHNIKIVHALPLPSDASEPISSTPPTVFALTSSTSSQTVTVPRTAVTPPSLQVGVLEELSAAFLTQTNLSSGSALNRLAANKDLESMDSVQDAIQKPIGKRKHKAPDPNLVMRPDGKSTSARNLYAIEWCKQNKKGTRRQYTEHWGMLISTKDPLVEVYEQCSAIVKGLKKQNTSSSITTSASPAIEDDMVQE
ncbi:hypothetical protein BS17DRAFT_812021 [Gyrodon lividus]|nr:hypothetical protein BS17DRAFT_812021 [Gyrodon lividus]